MTPSERLVIPKPNTLVCAVCATENDHLSIVCSGCGGYLQTKVENLDLFATAWGIIERPRKTFHTIAVARHKNYAIILSACFGIALAFALCWLVNAGEHTDSLFNIVGAATATGPILGIAALCLFALFVKILSSLSHTNATYWQIFATASYAMVPAIASLVFLLPIELMTFGIYLFTKNPSAYLLKPLSFVILIGLDGLLTLWSLILLHVGLKALFRKSWIRIVVITIGSLGVFAGSTYYLLEWIVKGV